MLSFWFEVNVNIGISEMCQWDNLSMCQFGNGRQKVGFEIYFSILVENWRKFFNCYKNLQTP